MKSGIFISIVFILVSLQCSNKDVPENEICTNNDDLLGRWKLVSLCDCYSLGGDLVWKHNNKNLYWEFDQGCNFKETGDAASNCNVGKFSINDIELTVIFNCPSGSTLTTNYEYNINGDTLTLKTWVEEGYFGSKYLRSK